MSDFLGNLIKNLNCNVERRCGDIQLSPISTSVRGFGTTCMSAGLLGEMVKSFFPAGKPPCFKFTDRFGG